MKTILSNVRDRINQARKTRSKWLSILAILLVGVLLLDVGFVIFQTLSMGTDIQSGFSVLDIAAQQSPPAKVNVTFVARASPSPASGTTTQPTATPAKQSASAATVAARQTVTPLVTPALTDTAPSHANGAQPGASQTQLAAAQPTSVQCTNPVGQLVTDTVQSKVLAREMQVHVYLPPCYDKSIYVYPALYLIQGSAFRFGEWVEDGVPRIADLHMSLGILPPFIIVMPASDLEGGNYSKYTYSVKGKGSWEDFIVNELVPTIEDRYGAWKNRAGRAIGGISRGGYWSLEIGFANPDKFSAVGGHSPSIMPDKLIGTPANFSMLSLAKSIDALKSVRIFLDAGDRDWAQSGVKRLSSDLDAKGISYTASSGEGGHEDSYWASRVPDYLAFYSDTWPIAPRTRSTQADAAPDSAGKQP
ncbi:MAG: esterase family protein [Chloroflexi bacterium]|nr:esterase family protein [Chloroflexota bacterium]